MSKIAFFALWAFAFVIPFELFIRWEEFGTMGRLVGVIAFGVGLVHIVLSGRLRPLGLFHVLTLFFVLWAGLSAFWTMDVSETKERVWTYTQLGFMVWLIWELAPSRDRQLDLLQAYVLGCYVSVLDTMMKFLAGVEQQTGRFAATGFNPNDLGFTLVLAIPMAWCLALSRPKGVLTWVNRLYPVFGMIAVILTASRGSFIPAFVALLIIPWTLNKLRPRSRVAICVGGAASLIMIASVVPETSWERLSTASDEIESGSFNERGDIWRSGLEVLVDHPLQGVGAGAYAVAIEPILGWGRPPHQTFLSVLVGQGIVGLALWLGMFATAFFPVLRMPAVERKLWLVILMTLGIGLQVRTWDYRKPLWLILGILAAHGVSTRIASRRPEPLGVAPELGEPEPVVSVRALLPSGAVLEPLGNGPGHH